MNMTKALTDRQVMQICLDALACTLAYLPTDDNQTRIDVYDARTAIDTYLSALDASAQVSIGTVAHGPRREEILASAQGEPHEYIDAATGAIEEHPGASPSEEAAKLCEELDEQGVRIWNNDYWRCACGALVSDEDSDDCRCPMNDHEDDNKPFSMGPDHAQR